MADNITVPGTGEILAYDDVGGVKYGRFKLDVGGDGAAVPITNTLGYLPVALRDSNGGELLASAHGKLLVGAENLLFYDRIDGTTINHHLWLYDTSAFAAITQASGFINLNVTPTVATGYGRIVSRRHAGFLGHFPIYLHVMVSATNLPTNAAQFLEFGVGSSAADTAAPGDGAFFRLYYDGSTARLIGVVKNGATETLTSTTAFTVSGAGVRFTASIIVDHSSVTFHKGGVNAVVSVPTNQATPFSTSRLPFFAKERNTGAVSTAIAGQVSEFVVALRDANNPKDWPTQMAYAQAQGAYYGPLSFTGNPYWPANGVAFPAAQTLSNTAAPGTFGSNLGGYYNFTGTMAVAQPNDYILFAYQVPAGTTLIIQTCRVEAPVVSTTFAGTAPIYDFVLAIGGTAVSLATADVAGGARARQIARRLGRWWGASATVAARIALNAGGTAATSGVNDREHIFLTPLVVESGQFVHVFVKPAHGTAPTLGAVEGGIWFDGYFE